MAKIRLRFGEKEVEIESRDFYIDNDTASQVISDLAHSLDENTARVVDEDSSFGAAQDIASTYQKNLDYLKMLKDVEFHEPEFTAAVPVSEDDLPDKLDVLESDGFFTKPRTVMETVEQLRDHGWVASPLEVSKELASRAFHKEFAKSVQENKAYYYKEQLIS